MTNSFRGLFNLLGDEFQHFRCLNPGVRVIQFLSNLSQLDGPSNTNASELLDLVSQIEKQDCLIDEIKNCLPFETRSEKKRNRIGLGHVLNAGYAFLRQAIDDI